MTGLDGGCVVSLQTLEVDYGERHADAKADLASFQHETSLGSAGVGGVPNLVRSGAIMSRIG
ncbi:hypothetical protein TcasGA2_TC034456 [Tribolium castaneum]|uniref:Uncharacterized protein n=1 Tax=Tribolium castaneum TaxID=7070 RepID=A0A139WBU5_TRICA|nr:hypothetical protein TcasGA2_TC034456 [Tribolium castaneum]